MAALGTGEGGFKAAGGSGEPLSPIVFRFTDTPSIPTAGTQPRQPMAPVPLPSPGAGSAPPSASSAAKVNKGSSGGNGNGHANGAGSPPSSSSNSSLAHSGASVVAEPPAAGSSTSSASGREAAAADDAPSGAASSSGSGSGSYSDFYRSAHTTFVRSGSDAASSQAASNPRTAPTSTQTDSPNGAGGRTQEGDEPRPAWLGAATSSSNYDGLTVHTASGTPGGDSSSRSSTGASTSGAATEAEVAQALARAHAALAKAESSLDDIERLSHTSLELKQPPTRWQLFVRIMRSVTGLAVITFGMLASHASGLAMQWVGAALGAAGIAAWGLRKGSLSQSGAAAAMLVGFGTLGSSLRFGATLLAFYFSSSKLTQYKEELKRGWTTRRKRAASATGCSRHAESSSCRVPAQSLRAVLTTATSFPCARSLSPASLYGQVFCNALVPTVLAVAYGILAGCVDLPLGAPTVEPWRAQALTAIMGGFLGYFACCCGDTWASELGPLSADTPRLITTLRPVRRGTNGGVTLLGLSASIIGGMFVGLTFYLAGLLSPTLWIFEQSRAVAASQWRLIPLGLMAGLLGSVLDSLLGATVQYTGYNTVTGRVTGKPGPDVVHISGLRILDNNAVNAVSASLTAALTAVLALSIFF